MKKKTKQIAEDNRGVAIYARKSRITNKGDSIGVQFKQCAEYAIRELSLDDDYTFINYEDKGLSGYYSDRPDFQRMLHDIEMGKIRAVVCYKLDRIGRKTADLLRLLDFLEKHKVDLLICSNNITPVAQRIGTIQHHQPLPGGSAVLHAVAQGGEEGVIPAAYVGNVVGQRIEQRQGIGGQTFGLLCIQTANSQAGVFVHLVGEHRPGGLVAANTACSAARR